MQVLKTISGALTISSIIAGGSQAAERPNILFAIADDWGVHAGAYGDRVVQTPVFDRLASQGVLFENAYVSSPSCGPSRAAILSGQWHWRLEDAASLRGPIAPDVPLYPDLLAAAGYEIGIERKGWGPGRDCYMNPNPAGPSFDDFKTFMEQRTEGTPFCFWFGSHDPHRGYVKGSGVESGIPAGKIQLSAAFPDSEEIRSDVADYYYEVQRFDREVGERLALIDAAGELENTIIVVTSDHGMPFPRAKCNLYDDGVRVPLVIYWPGHFEGGFRVTDFVSTTDFAPTFLEVAGLQIPDVMTGRSLVPQLTAGRGGRIDPGRNYILFGRERHTASQEAPIQGGYPMRAIRTDDFLLIHNFEPDRWPTGTPNGELAFVEGAWYGDCDPCPSKTYMIENRDKDAEHRRLFELAFNKRPEFELYDVDRDPDQQKNVAANPEYSEELARLQHQLDAGLRDSDDPRVFGRGEVLDGRPYDGGVPTRTGANTSLKID